MKKIVLALAATTALAGCGSNEAEAPVEPADTTVAQTDTASAGQMAGTYEITESDGTVTRQEVNADGTYVDRDLDGNETERGTWRQSGDQLCYDAEGDAAEVCWIGGAPGADGSFEATTPDGSASATIRKIED